LTNPAPRWPHPQGLSNRDWTSGNSIAEPAKIVPTETTVNVSADFTHTFPANSINVLRVKPANP